MFGWSRFKPRAVPDRRSLVMAGRRGTLPFRYELGADDDYIFTVDIWAYLDKRHPEQHLGWWRFELPRGERQAELTLDFDPIDMGSLTLTVDGTSHRALDGWQNPDYPFDPLADLELVLRDGDGEVQRVERTLLKFSDREDLRRYYARHFEADGYRSAAEAPFLPTLHEYKLKLLERLFLKHIPAGGWVVDVGCGRSLFTDIETTFPFTVFAGDLNFDSVRARAVKIPSQRWGVFDASAVPLADASVDALFAGEVIEHVTDVEATLREWCRVLKPGGVAIITTPNRDRLVSVVGGMERPYSRDHLRELSYRELTRTLLPASGLRLVEQSGIYLELWLKNVFRSEPVYDHLQLSEGNSHGYVPLMRRLYPLGRWFPWWALGIVVVARKEGGSGAG